ncbi:unnamed protein product, partial [Symbiodinium pilosum]
YTSTEYAEIGSSANPRTSEPPSSTESPFTSTSTMWLIRPRETRKLPFSDTEIDRMEVRFAADAAAASHSRYWKFEASARGQVTAQVYFLKGNVSFDPITKEAV